MAKKKKKPAANADETVVMTDFSDLVPVSTTTDTNEATAPREEEQEAPAVPACMVMEEVVPMVPDGQGLEDLLGGGGPMTPETVKLDASEAVKQPDVAPPPTPPPPAVVIDRSMVEKGDHVVISTIQNCRIAVLPPDNLHLDSCDELILRSLSWATARKRHLRSYRMDRKGVNDPSLFQGSRTGRTAQDCGNISMARVENWGGTPPHCLASAALAPAKRRRKRGAFQRPRDLRYC